MRRISARILALLSLIPLLPSTATAQTAAPREGRPKVGLALAGGSALGLAHIGVIQWLEEHHVPVDYIAGTSMGGLIGGLYASGYSAEEMKQFIASTKWEKVFQVSVPYPQNSFRRKQDRRDFTGDLEFGLRGGFRVPPGFSAGQEVQFVLSRFAAPYSDMASFDDLPTPFRCVATDLAARKEIVLDKGSLADALRATMSLPAIFAPLRKDGMVLADGGLLNNMPANVVKAMGADYVIAVSLDATDTSNASLESFVGVANRSVEVVLYQNERRNLRFADLLLNPDLAGFDSVDFQRATDLEARGYEEAERKGLFLKTLAVSDEEWSAHLEARRSRRREVSSPQFVKVEGAGNQERKLERELHSFVGITLDEEKLHQKLDRIAGRGRYATASYEAVDADGKQGLSVRVLEKNYAPPLLNLGVTVSGPQVNDMRFQLDGRVTFLDFGVPGTEWRSDLNLGYRNRIATEYIWRPWSGPFFLGPRGFYDANEEGIYQGTVFLAEYDFRRAGAGFDVGLLPGVKDEIRLGFEFSRLDAAPTVGAMAIPRVFGDFHFLRLRWEHDDTDSPAIPRKGIRSAASLGWEFTAPGVPRGFPVFESQLLAAVPLSERNTLLAIAAGGTTFHQATPYSTFTLGGPFQLSALAPYQLRGDNYYSHGLSFLRELYGQPVSIFSRLYLSAGYELGSAFEDYKTSRLVADGTLGFAGVTRLGVFFVGGSVGEFGERKIFVRIGPFYQPRE